MGFTGVDEVIEALADESSFTAWTAKDLGLPEFDYAAGADEHSLAYAAEIAKAQSAVGTEESIVTGLATIDSGKVVLVLGNFDFLAGSVGRRACQFVIAAFNRAAKLGLPVFASPASGGTRMQEGTPAFVLMIDVANAVRRFRANGQPLVVWLRNPTTGGVMATWGSLGSVTFAEPGALTGFLGPRVYEVLHGEKFPAGIQTSEHLAEVGVIDGVIELDQLADAVSPLLRLRMRKEVPAAGAPVGALPATTEPAWDKVQRTRLRQRPSARDVIAANLTDTVGLKGTTTGERSEAITVTIGRWHGLAVVVIAQDRIAQEFGHGLTGVSLRVARRGIALAQELRLPIVTLIETAGAELSVAAEESALAGEIARTLAELSGAEVPTISVVLGMGCGGAALAMLPADTVLAAESAWVSPLPLEGASVIRYRTADRAGEMAERQQITAIELAERGVVDQVIPEGDEARDLPANVGIAVTNALTELTQHDGWLAKRQARYSGGLDVH